MMAAKEAMDIDLQSSREDPITQSGRHSLS